jgi:hypothetical protein
LLIAIQATWPVLFLRSSNPYPIALTAYLVDSIPYFHAG